MRKNLRIFILGVFCCLFVNALLGYIIENRLIKLVVSVLVIIPIYAIAIKYKTPLALTDYDIVDERYKKIMESASKFTLILLFISLFCLILYFEYIGSNDVAFILMSVVLLGVTTFSIISFWIDKRLQ